MHRGIQEAKDLWMELFSEYLLKFGEYHDKVIIVKEDYADRLRSAGLF